jgi:hypothetical protein
VNKNDLIAAVASSTGFSKAETTKVVDGVFHATADTPSEIAVALGASDPFSKTRSETVYAGHEPTVGKVSPRILRAVSCTH